MARHSMKASDGEGFLRAFTDAWADLEADTDYRLELCVFRTNRKGVLQFRLRAYKVPVDVTGPYSAAYQMEYPTAQVGTLEAALYQSVVKIERLLADADERLYRSLLPASDRAPGGHQV